MPFAEFEVDFGFDVCPLYRERRQQGSRMSESCTKDAFWAVSWPPPETNPPPRQLTASPKPHPCNMAQAKTEVALQFLESCAAETALQHSLFCSADVIFTKSCAAASEKLHGNIEQKCGPTFRHPCLGPAETNRKIHTVLFDIWTCLNRRS